MYHRVSEKPSVSIVITCFNYSKLLPRALESVEAQTHSDWEIVIVDDGSTDASLDVALQHARERTDQNIKVVHTRNGGLPRARNLGVALSRGRYISCLDADDWYEPQALERMVGVLDTRADISVVSPGPKFVGAEDIVPHHPPYDFEVLTSRNIVSQTSLFRREAWLQVGGHNENMRGYDDWEFWISVGEAGFGFETIDEHLWNWRVSTDGKYVTKSRPLDLPLRAEIVRAHPATYDEAAQNLAVRILAGQDIDDCLMDAAPIFAGSIRAEQLRSAR
jgi:glycosyltransferase involved in cell wall biosynthesis